jgi:hypothetical protein
MTDTTTNPETEPNDMALTTKINNLFKSRDGQLVDTVTGKLAAARAAHDALLSQRPDAALADAMGEEGAADALAALMAEIAASEQRISLLTLALEEAEKREAERKRQARLAADKSRVRALEQHLGRLRVAAAQYERAVSECAQAWSSMLDASRRASQLLIGGDDRAGAELISPAKLREYCTAQMELQAYPQHPSEIAHPLPGARLLPYWDGEQRPRPLTETLTSHCDWLLGKTAASGEARANAGVVSDAA